MLSLEDAVFIQACFGVYLGLSLIITRRVGGALAAAGEPLLVRCFGLDAATARHLVRALIVGYYLLNVGFVMTRAEGWESRPEDPVFGIVAKLGISLMVLGTTYYLALFAAMRLGRAARGWIGEREADGSPHDGSDTLQP